MIKLTESVKAWKTPSFKEIFVNEVSQLDGRLLPLQQAVSRGSYANVENFKVMLLNINEKEESFSVKVGIFFNSLVAGCTCSDDPTPEGEISEYCELRFDINKRTAETSISLYE